MSAPLFERLMEIHSNPPVVYYAFSTPIAILACIFQGYCLSSMIFFSSFKSVQLISKVPLSRRVASIKRDWAT